MIGDGVPGKTQVLGRQPLQKALGVAQVPEKVVVGLHGARGHGVGIGQHAHGDACKPERRPHQRAGVVGGRDCLLYTSRCV